MWSFLKWLSHGWHSVLTLLCPYILFDPSFIRYSEIVDFYVVSFVAEIKSFACWIGCVCVCLSSFVCVSARVYTVLCVFESEKWNEMNRKRYTVMCAAKSVNAWLGVNGAHAKEKCEKNKWESARPSERQEKRKKQRHTNGAISPRMNRMRDFSNIDWRSFGFLVSFFMDSINWSRCFQLFVFESNEFFIWLVYSISPPTPRSPSMFLLASFVLGYKWWRWHL